MTEIEFITLQHISRSPILRNEDFDNIDEVCEAAKSLLNRGLITTISTKPFRINYQGGGRTYDGGGKFNLSPIGQEISALDNFSVYKRMYLRPKSKWNLSTRLTCFGIVIALIPIYFSLFGIN